MTEEHDKSIWTPADAGTVMFIALGCTFGCIALGLFIGWMVKTFLGA